MNIPYKEYLNSKEWKAKKKLAIKYAEGKCQVCYSSKRIDVHHRTYERLGNEKQNDLTVLCHSCHGRFHDKILSPSDFIKLKTKLELNNKKLETEKNHEKIILLLRENEKLSSQLRKTNNVNNGEI